uniref:Membrane spanning 4-domains A12 n=1 Tax=Propithecus coquereli TaxID=379532 RepID=A0A2K6GM64_PROCO
TMSSKPTSHPGVHETTPNPYPASSFVAPRFQQPQPLGSIDQGNQAQSGQPPLITSPGAFAGSQLGQGNTQMTNPSMGTVATNFMEEAKTLGFIVSGSLSVSATKEFSSCLIKSSLGMNIVSCIFALVGIILLLVDMCINSVIYQTYWTVVSGKGISAMLMIFSLLEFCIACATAHFAQQIISSTSRAILVIPAPTVYANNPFPPESSSTPPRYDGYPPYAPRY